MKLRPWGGYALALVLGAFLLWSHDVASKADARFTHSRDSLEHIVADFQSQHDSLVTHVDTVRATRVVTLRGRADTIVQRIHEISHDTVTLALIDSAAVYYRQAIDTLTLRVAFWHGQYDSVVAQRDRAMALLHTIKPPPSWNAALTFDTQGGVSGCALRSMGRVLGLGLNVGVCVRR